MTRGRWGMDRAGLGSDEGLVRRGIGQYDLALGLVGCIMSALAVLSHILPLLSGEVSVNVE